MNELLDGSYRKMCRKLPLLLQNRRANWFIPETPDSDFDAIGVYHALPLDEFYLGFLLGKSAPDEELQEIMENNELGDNSEVRGYIIKQATSDERSTLRDMLSSYFGSDVALFWALHHAIWPKYNEPSADLCNELVNPSSFEDVSEVSDAWEFVTTGWTDSADE